MANFFTVKVFDNLCDRDQTTEIIGFVDEISAPAEVGAKKKNRSYLNLFWAMGSKEFNVWYGVRSSYKNSKARLLSIK